MTAANPQRRRQQSRRLFWLGFLLVAAFAGLGYRLVDLQVLRHEILHARSLRQTQISFSREPRRGDIRDIRGHLLATSQFVKTICADPTLIGPHVEEVARALAPLLQTNEAYLVERLRPQVLRQEGGAPVYDRYVVLKRKVKLDEWERIREVMADLAPAGRRLTLREKSFLRVLRQQAIFADAHDDQLRFYPMDTLAAHILGFVATETGPSNVIENIGKDGIELIFNRKLTGVRGWRSTERDQRGRELMAFREQDIDPRAGLNVVLTLDAGLQHILHEEMAAVMEKHAPVSAGAIIVRPATGEVLAMAGAPLYDANNPGAAPVEARRNRLIADLAEPGSTFKIVVVSAALNEGLITLADRFDCEHGRFMFAGKPLRDDEAHGVLSVEEIIAKSSNIGSAKIGLKLGADRLHGYMRAFGFGDRTGIPLPGEAGGIVHPVGRWSGLSITRIPMGHEVAATQLQMTMAMGALANEGRLMRPMLVDRLEDPQGRVVVKYQPQLIRQVVSAQTAQLMVAALKGAVSTNGTGTKAMLDHYSAAGKTGTAQKPGPGGYLPGKYIASFIGFFPADDPQLCISVVLDEPKHGYYGGQTAAPVFKAIAERAANYLSIRPDTLMAAARTDPDPARRNGP